MKKLQIVEYVINQGTNSEKNTHKIFMKLNFTFDHQNSATSVHRQKNLIENRMTPLLRTLKCGYHNLIERRLI